MTATIRRTTADKKANRVFSHDVTAAILVSQNNETAAVLVSQNNPLGVEVFSYANASFCSNKFAWMLATLVKTLYGFTLAKQQLCTCVTSFCIYLCRCCTNTTVKLPSFTFYGELEHKTTISVKRSFSFSELRYSFSESTPEKAHNNWQIEWNGIRVCNEVWNSKNSLFKWRFRCRWRRHSCLSSLFYKSTN